MKYSGKTPLLRAMKLEKQLGVKRIYLKLEGANPTHHKYARIAEVLTKDAVAHRNTGLVAYGTYPYLKAIRYFAEKEGLDLWIPRLTNESWKSRRFDQEMLIDLRKEKVDDKIDYLKRLAAQKGLYLAMEGYTNNHLSLMALEELGQELIRRLPSIDTIFTEIGHGYTLSALYNVLLKQWIENDEPFPKMFCGVPKGDPLDMAAKGDVFAYIEADPSLLESSRQALKESYGRSIDIDEDQLKAAKRLLRETENVRISKENAYPLAAFLSQIEANQISKGIHVIVLDDGRSLMDIDEVHDYTAHPKDEILTIAKTYLAEYSDPLIEMKDALENAIDKGFVLLARQDEVNLGVAIIVNTRFRDFIPTYHLAYIGTNQSYKGRGIGTELIRRAVEVTDGNISLHVDLDNKNAKKLYEKMGFKHVYNRMIYYGE